MLDDFAISGSLAESAQGDSEPSWSLYPDPDLAEPARGPVFVAGPGPILLIEDGRPPAGVRQRRREPRYRAIENRLWLQWWEGEEHLGRSARLVNVSRHGALIVACVLFRERQRLWVYLEEPAPQIGVKAVVLGINEGTTGMHQIRLGFVSECPDAFIEAAANGFESWLACKRPRY
jgi:hypothetical protein